jgi:hypothetical protein
MAIVFVASSTEAKGIAEKVAQALERKDQRALRWWDVFRVGDVTLDRLRSLSDTTDGAVLVWDADDKTWQRGQELESTRDNCILEYGLFVSKLGRQRTAVFVRDTVKLPSDIAGITVVAYNDENLDKKLRQLTADLIKNLVPKSPDIVPIYIDDDVHSNALDPGKFPPNWASRALYVTDAGASRWLRMTRDPKYALGIADPLGVLSIYIKIVYDFIPKAVLKQLGLIVSLGPGGAHHEQQLLDALASGSSERLFQWIPVDISNGLLSHCVSRLMGSQAIPMGIVGDHEDGLSFIFGRMLSKYTDVRPSMLVTMFGGTFANLDGLEGRFVNELKGRLVSNDYVLIDMPVKGTQWKQEEDPRADIASYSLEMREFIGGGLADRLGVPGDRASIVEQFTTRVVAEYTKSSDIPGTSSIEIKDSDTTQLLLRFRRYDLDELKTWFLDQDGLEVVKVMTTEAGTPDIMNMAVILLRKI